VNKNCEDVPEWIDWAIKQPLSYPEILQRSREIFDNKNYVKRKKVKKNEKKLSLKDMRILLVEDNPVNRKVASALLKKIGADFDTVENGEEAYIKRISDFYHLILMDIEMPVLDGISATEKILKYEKENNKEHTPIIALTANTLEETKQKYPNFNMDGLLSKPIKSDELEETLQKVLNSKNSNNSDEDINDEVMEFEEIMSISEKLEKEEQEKLQKSLNEAIAEKNIILISNMTNITRTCSISFGKLGIFISQYTEIIDVETLTPKKDIVLLQNNMIGEEGQRQYLKLLKDRGVESFVIIDNEESINDFYGKEFAKPIRLVDLEAGNGAEKILRGEL